MTTFYYLIAAILTSQPGVSFKGFDANVIAKYTNLAMCQAAVPAVEALAVNATSAGINNVNSNNHAFCVAAPSVASGPSYTMVSQAWDGRSNPGKQIVRFTVPSFISLAACEGAGDVVENEIESHFSTTSIPNVFVDTACIKVQ